VWVLRQEVRKDHQPKGGREVSGEVRGKKGSTSSQGAKNTRQELYTGSDSARWGKKKGVGKAEEGLCMWEVDPSGGMDNIDDKDVAV